MTDSLATTTSTKVLLKDCCEEISQRIDNPAESGFERFVGLEHLETGETSISNWGSTEDVTSSMKLFKTGDVIVARRNVYLRRAARAHFDGVCSGDGIVLRPNSDICLSELLPFLLNTDAFWAYVTSQADGTMSKRITVKRLLSYEFPLPPLEKQRRIAEVLNASEVATVSLSKLRDQAWKTNIANYKDVTGQSDSEWGVKTIKSTCRIENRLRKPLSSKVRSDMQGDYPYYGATGLLDSIAEYRLDGKYALIGEDGDHFLKYSQQSMTQLISGQFNVNNHAHVIAGTDQCLTEWFYHYYRYRDVRKWLTKQGSGRLKLKKATLEKMPIAMPPIKEQRKLVSRLESTADAVLAIEKRIHNCRSLQKQLIVNLLQTTSEQE
jgi:type I restriction enzyme, S subunit